MCFGSAPKAPPPPPPPAPPINPIEIAPSEVAPGSKRKKMGASMLQIPLAGAAPPPGLGIPRIV